VIRQPIADMSCFFQTGPVVSPQSEPHPVVLSDSPLTAVILRDLAFHSLPGFLRIIGTACFLTPDLCYRRIELFFAGTGYFRIRSVHFFQNCTDRPSEFIFLSETE